MNKIKIKSPVRSVSAAKLISKAGANEIYLGVEVEDLNSIAFDGRGKKSQWDDELTHVKNFDELKEIVKIAHDRNVNVDFTANMPCIPADEKGKNQFLNHVEKAVEAGVDAVILADLAAIKLVKEKNYSVKIYTSTFLDSINLGQVNFLKNLGADRILLPNQLTPEELKEMTKDQAVEYEVFGHFGCSNYNGTCYILHGTGEKVNLGMPCRSRFHVTGDGNEIKNSNFMDAGEDCSICFIPRLIDAGINSLKIVGRALSPNYIAAITKLYRKSIDAYYDGKPVEDVKNKVLDMMPDWKTSYCTQNRCKYGNTKVVEHFI